MDKTTETSTTTTTANNATHGASTSGNAGSGGGGGITDRPATSSATTTNLQQAHENMSLGCGSTTRLPTKTAANTAKVCNAATNANKLTTTTTVGCSTSTTSAAATSASAAAAIKSLQQKSTIINGKQHPAPSSSAAGATTTATTITQFGMTLPQALHQHRHHHNLAGLINLNVNTTTGGNFGVTVLPTISVENLKKIVAKKLKVAKDRICLLHREKELQDGTLKDNNLMDGSKIILIPNVETGLLAQRPENTVMQALESLNDSQVNDFLSGKTPLNLSMRLGDHMMLIQLQLSTVNPAGNAVGAGGAHASNGACTASRMRSSSQRSSSSRASNGTNPTTTAAAAGASTSSAASTAAHHSHHHHHHYHHHNSNATPAAASANPQQAANSSTQQTNGIAAASTSGTARKLNLDASHGQSNNMASCQRSITIHANPANNRNTITTHNAAGPQLNATTTKSIRTSDLSTLLSKRDFESLQNIVKSFAMSQPGRLQAAAAAAHNHQAMRATVPTANNVANSISGPNVARSQAANATTATDAALLEQSPIKSLSNLVSSPIKTTAIKHIPIATAPPPPQPAPANNSSSGSTPACQQDPIAAKLTSCLCTRLHTGAVPPSSKHCIENACAVRQDANLTQTNAQQQLPQQRHIMITSTPNGKSQTAAAAINSNSNAVLHKTANNPITRSKHRHHHHHHHHHHHYHHASGTGAATGPQRQQQTLLKPQVASASRCHSVNSNDSGFASDDSVMSTVPAAAPIPASMAAPMAASNITTIPNNANNLAVDDSGIAIQTDTRTLAEASRNLTQTLRKLSKEVFTNKIDLSSNDEAGQRGKSGSGNGTGTGAVIESMKNHGKGIYSGTFSGTLNPALQDRYGRPKRDISTVIHILNDLLSATPQYSRGARISFEAPTTSAAAAAASAGSAHTDASSTSMQHSSRSKQVSSKHHSHSCVKCIKAAHAHAHAHASQSSNGATTSTNSVQCNYGECHGHYKTHAKSIYACCQDVTAAAATTTAPTTATKNERNACNCRYRLQRDGDPAAGEREREYTCQKCLSDMDNLKTKSKMNQIRLVMQQSKQKREARKLKGAPYGARVVGAVAAPAAAQATNTQAATAMAATDAGGMLANTNSATQNNSATLSNATTAATTLATAATAATSEVSPNHLVEEVDTAA